MTNQRFVLPLTILQLLIAGTLYQPWRGFPNVDFAFALTMMTLTLGVSLLKGFDLKRLNPMVQCTVALAPFALAFGQLQSHDLPIGHVLVVTALTTWPVLTMFVLARWQPLRMAGLVRICGVLQMLLSCLLPFPPIQYLAFAGGIVSAIKPRADAPINWLSTATFTLAAGLIFSDFLFPGCCPDRWIWIMGHFAGALSPLLLLRAARSPRSDEQ